MNTLAGVGILVVAGLAVAQGDAKGRPVQALMQQASARVVAVQKDLDNALARFTTQIEDCERRPKEGGPSVAGGQDGRTDDCRRSVQENRRAYVTAARMAIAYYQSLDAEYFAGIERRYGKGALANWAEQGLGGGVTEVPYVDERGGAGVATRFEPPRLVFVDQRTLGELGGRSDPSNGAGLLPSEFPVPAGFARRVGAVIPTDVRVEWNSTSFDPAVLNIVGGASVPAQAGVMNATLHAAQLFDGLPYKGDARDVLRHDKVAELDCTTLTYEVFREIAGPDAEPYRSQAKVGAPSESWDLARAVEDRSLRTRGVVGALTQSGTGFEVSVAEAQPGDFVQYWLKNRAGDWKGHSAIVSEIRDDADGRQAVIYGAHETKGKVTYRNLHLDSTARTGRIYIGRFRPDVIQGYWMREGLLLRPSPTQLQEWTFATDRGQR